MKLLVSDWSGHSLTPLCVTHDAVLSHLDVVILAQVGWLQVEVAEVQSDPEPDRDTEVPLEPGLSRVRVWEVWRLQAAVHHLSAADRTGS